MRQFLVVFENDNVRGRESDEEILEEEVGKTGDSEGILGGEKGKGLSLAGRSTFSCHPEVVEEGRDI